MRTLKTRTAGLAAAALLALGAVTLSAGPASASETKCDYGADGGNVNVCMSVTGGGLYVEYMVASAQVLNYTTNIQVCIHSNVTSTAIKCTNFQNIAPGRSLVIQWTVYGNVPGGDYCSNAWHQHSVFIGQGCVGVVA